MIKLSKSFLVLLLSGFLTNDVEAADFVGERPRCQLPRYILRTDYEQSTSSYVVNRIGNLALYLGLAHLITEGIAGVRDNLLKIKKEKENPGVKARICSRGTKKTNLAKLVLAIVFMGIHRNCPRVSMAMSQFIRLFINPAGLYITIRPCLPPDLPFRRDFPAQLSSPVAGDSLSCPPAYSLPPARPGVRGSNGGTW